MRHRQGLSMGNVVDMEGKLHEDCSTESFPAWTKYIESILWTQNDTLGKLIEAHNEVVARIGQLESIKREKKKWYQLWRR